MIEIDRIDEVSGVSALCDLKSDLFYRPLLKFAIVDACLCGVGTFIVEKMTEEQQQQQEDVSNNKRHHSLLDDETESTTMTTPVTLVLNNNQNNSNPSSCSSNHHGISLEIENAKEMASSVSFVSIEYFPNLSSFVN